MNKRTIRWGILGCGDVTEKKSGPAFQKAHGSSLVAVMRRSAPLARDYALRHGVGRWYDDAEALIADPQVDAVYVATPPDSHKRYALDCARAGKPCYVEKPMALDAPSCLEMVEAFRAAQVPLFVAYYRRALPRFVRLKELVSSGVIGAPRLVQITHYRAASASDRALPWRVRPELSGGGHFVDLGCHTLDLLGWILGPIESAQGVAANQAGLYPAEDTVAACLRFSGGALGAGIWCFAAAGREDRVELLGDRGMIRFSTFGESALQISVDGRVTLETIPHPDPIQLPLVQTIVDELRGQGRCPSTGETAVHTTRAIDQILQGWRSNLQNGAEA